MIKSITIDYTQPLPNAFHYLLGEHRKQLLPKQVKFKPGLNVVVGENGCGKTTLINLLASYTFCEAGMPGLPCDVGLWKILEKFYPKGGFYSFLRKEIDFTPIRSIRLEHDYDLPVMKMRGIMGYDNDELLSSIERLSDYWYGSRQSSGQNKLHSLARFAMSVREMRKEYNRYSPLPDTGRANDTYSTAVEKLKEWIDANTVPMTDGQCTILMDEPDASLDIKHLALLRDWLLTNADAVQIIVVLHNPLLIRSLSDAGANIVQLSKGYLKMIKEF